MVLKFESEFAIQNTTMLWKRDDLFNKADSVMNEVFFKSEIEEKLSKVLKDYW